MINNIDSILEIGENCIAEFMEKPDNLIDT